MRHTMHMIAHAVGWALGCALVAALVVAVGFVLLSFANWQITEPDWYAVRSFMALAAMVGFVSGIIAYLMDN